MKALSFILLTLCSTLLAQPIFREDFRDDVAAHIPVTNEDLTSDFLTLKRLGPGADKIKLSYHPEIENDPHYVWNGECSGPTLLAFDFKEKLNLSSSDWFVKVGSKNVGQSKLHLALRIDNKWFIRKEALENQNEWNEQTLKLSASTWLTLDPNTITIGTEQETPNLKETNAIGFVSPHKPQRSADCTRLNWFELLQSDKAPPKKKLPENGFLEPETPFLRSALVYEHEGHEHFVRRGILIPLHYRNRWACFDPDTLHWAVVWEAPPGTAPITYDSMAGVSFPNKKAKAKRAPRLLGKILIIDPNFTNPQRKTPKPSRQKFGPLSPAAGEWIGITLSGNRPLIRYRLDSTIVSELVTSSQNSLFEHQVKIEGNDFFGQGFHNLKISHQPDGKLILTKPQPLITEEPKIIFPTAYSVENHQPQEKPPFTTRSLIFPPKSERPIRATDLAFKTNGDAFLTTLDGDVWRIENCEKETSTWTRIATGLFEPIAIEVDHQDRLFTLGRDGITELIDSNNDGHIDRFHNASDAFLQTLHTRDYATSLAIGADGSFLIAKGGIFEPEKNNIENELSEHRGTILHISSDGKTATVLADGLRLPYVGLRSDGTVFASDQQGHYIPSSPLHLISNETPYLGFEPTNFKKRKTATPPLLWYPYQANRSSAAFCTTSSKAFPDIPNTFLQVSWNGRLFAIETPKEGQPFSWQLPLQLDFPALNGATHPESGHLYLTGLGISGYLPTTPKFVGLASIAQNQNFPTPTQLEVTDNSLKITFNRPLTQEETITPGNPTLRLFNIKRTPKYGSGHYLWDGNPGEHQFAAKKFQLSANRKTFEISFEPLRHSDLLDLQLNISTSQTTFPIHLYTRPNHLPLANEEDLLKLAQAQENRPQLTPGNPKRGKTLFTQYGCIGCHSLQNQKLVGPPLNGVAKQLSKAKLRESILNPNAEIAPDFAPAMPSFEGVIPLQELEDLLSFLQTLK